MTPEDEPHVLALRDGASALKYRAERLRDVAGADDYAQAMVAQFQRHAQVLDDMADGAASAAA